MLDGPALAFRPPRADERDLRTLRIGVATIVATALVDNLRGLHVRSLPREDVEPLGSIVLIACLGTIAVRRAFKESERLLAIDKELSIARRIQSSILPAAMPKIGGLADRRALRADDRGRGRLLRLPGDRRQSPGHPRSRRLRAWRARGPDRLDGQGRDRGPEGAGRTPGRRPRRHERDARGPSRRPIRHRGLSLPRSRSGTHALQRGRPPAAPALAPRRGPRAGDRGERAAPGHDGRRGVPSARAAARRRGPLPALHGRSRRRDEQGGRVLHDRARQGGGGGERRARDGTPRGPDPGPHARLGGRGRRTTSRSCSSTAYKRVGGARGRGRDDILER